MTVEQLKMRLAGHEQSTPVMVHIGDQGVVPIIDVLPARLNIEVGTDDPVLEQHEFLMLVIPQAFQ